MKKILAFLLSLTVLLMTASPAYGAAIHQSSAVISQNQPPPTVPWSISTVDSVNSPAWRTAIDLDTSNHPHVSYFTWEGSLRYASWDGSAWNPVTLATGLKGANGPEPAESIGVHMRTSLKLDASNNPHISYADYADPDNGNLGYTFSNGSSFSFETADNTSKTGWFSSLAFDTNGTPLISYYDYGNNDLKLAVRVGSDNWTSQTIDSTGDIGRWTSLAISSDNVIHIGYFDATNTSLKYARWDGSWTISTLDVNAGDQALSLALDSSNNPRIAYYGSSSVPKFISYNGTTWSSPETIPDIGIDVDTGWWNSLAIDSSNNPHIACFQYGSNNGNPYNLIYATKSGSTWSVYTIENEGDVGSNTSLTLDSTGHPFIVHQNNTAHTLECVTTAWPVVTNSSATDITTGSATLHGNLASLGVATTATVSFEYGPTTGYGSTAAGSPATLTSTGAFSAAITSLTAGQLYHFRAKAVSAGYPDTYSADMTFTVSTQAPQVTTTDQDPTQVSNNSALASGNLASMGSATSVDVFFEYGLDTNYGNSTSTQTLATAGSFSISITGLNPGINYHFRARANGGLSGNATGTDKTFTTKTGPGVTTVAPTGTDILTTTAVLRGNLTSLGTATSAGLSFQYGPDTNYGSSITAIPASSAAPTAFTATITGLTPGATYHFRAVADGGASGTNYGEDRQFNALLPPSVTTNAASNIALDSARLNGTLSQLGNTDSVIVTFEYGQDTAYGSTVTATQSPMTGIGVFSADISSLASATDYHFRAKADGGINGIVYGSDVTIRTGSTSPSITTDNVTNVTNNSASVAGSLTNLGTATTVNVSFEYGLTTSYGSVTTPGTMIATGIANGSITGLLPGTTYHFRAKADGGAHGAGYGEDMTFTTEIPPTATTNIATNILTDTATLNGHLDTMGTATTVNVSFEYGLDTNYGTATTSQTMSGTDDYSIIISGLIPGATYHFRAKVDGGLSGVGYGNDRSLQTVFTPPTVLTGSAGSLTGYSAAVSGNLTGRGTASIINVSFEYGPTTGYGSTTTPVALDGTGAFTATISGLNRNTVYYFRAKADGGYSGIAYGTDQTFTTLNPPLVVTNAASAVSYTSATLNANLSDLGSSTPPVSVVFEYGTTTAYSSVTVSVTMPNTGLISADATGLSSGTVYHFRARVDGGAQGFYYGSDMTFTTSQVSSGGWGGGGGGSVSPAGPGITSLSPYINSEGLFNLAAVIKSEDGFVQINVEKGVLARTSDNQPLNYVKIVPIDTNPNGQNDIELISKVYEITPAGATFNPSISIMIFYDAASLPKDIDISSLAIGVYNTTESRWQLLDSVVDQAAHRVTAQIGHFSQYALIGKNTPPITTPPPPKPAEFSVSGAKASPASSLPGKDITISIKVSNTGGTQGSYVVILKVNGVTESSKTVEVPAGSEQSVSFTVNEDTPGNYLVDINGVKTSFQIEAPTPTSTTPAATATPGSGGTSAWLIVIYVIAGVIVIGVIAYFITKTVRSRKRF